MSGQRIVRAAVFFSLAAILTLPDHALAQRISGGRPGVHVGGRIGGRTGGGGLVRPGRFWAAPRARFGPSARSFHPGIVRGRGIVRGGVRGRFDRPPLGHVRFRTPLRGHVGFGAPRHHLGFFGFPHRPFGFFGFPHHHHFGFFGFPRHHFGFFFGSPFVHGFGFSGFPRHHFGFFGFSRHHFRFFGFPHQFGTFGFTHHPFGFFGTQTLLFGPPLGVSSVPYTTNDVAVRDARQYVEARPARGRQLAVAGTGVGDSLVVEQVSVMDLVPTTAVRLTWRSAGLEAEQVVLFLADTAQSTLAAQTLRAPPHTALFEAPAGTAFAGMSVLWPDGTTSTRIVPYRAGPR